MRSFAVLMAALAAPALAAQTEPNAQPDPARFQRDIAEFEKWDRKNAFPANGVLFVGSSTIVMWPTRMSFDGLPVINRGFGGSHISDVEFYFPQIVRPYKPAVIVFYAGDNDIASGKNPAQVLSDFERFVSLTKADLPDTTVIFISIKPSESRWALWSAMKEANEMIRQVCRKDSRLVYVDAASLLLSDEGRPDPACFLEDKLHMSPRGYQKWTELLRPVIDRALERSADKK